MSARGPSHANRSARIEVSLRFEALESRRQFSCSSASLCAAEVETLLDRASAATPSDEAIIAIVDRGGHILRVRTEAGVPTGAPDFLVFAVDGAVAKARTAAFFANNQAPLTSRTVQFISQTTIIQREVDSNPNADPTLEPELRGPGFVAPIGVGGHFPPSVRFTPQVDLFAIENTNRDSIIHPGPDHIRGTADDIFLPARFNIDPAFIPAGQEIDAPESYGRVSGMLPNAQSRGIATLPGGVPIYKDSDGDGRVDALVGGIGVFFPGSEGFASYEQGFGTSKHGVNAPLVLEAEFTAAATVAGNLSGTLGGVPPVAGIGVSRLKGRLDLVGITLDTIGPKGGQGLRTLLKFGKRLGSGVVNGINLPIDSASNTSADGEPVPEGWLVTPHAGGGLSALDVGTLIDQAIAEANRVRAAIRLPLSRTTRIVFSVTDLDGNVLGLYRMPDATFFSIDVATAKARNVAYYSDPTATYTTDALDGNGDGAHDLPPGVAFSNRTFRYLALPYFPEGIDSAPPGPFSILNDAPTCVDPRTLATLCPISYTSFTSVLGFDAFNPGTNFQDPGDPMNSVANENGVIFFPGSMPVYKAGVLVGGFGVSGDGVDQDDVVTVAGAKGLLPPDGLRADRFFVRGIRLPFIKYLRNPLGLS